MIFRLRQYTVAPVQINVFNTFFQERLLPVQKRYGANLIGRWQTENGSQVFALWVYNNIEQYKSTQAKVRSKVEESYHKREQSKQLLEISKIGVEKAIEENEERATAWIDRELEKLNINLSAFLAENESN